MRQLKLIKIRLRETKNMNEINSKIDANNFCYYISKISMFILISIKISCSIAIFILFLSLIDLPNDKFEPLL